MITTGGSVELEITAGLADVEAGLLSTPQTRFQIASVSKQFAAAAVLLLAERGTVALDEPIDRWFPRCPTPWREITVHHLLTHTSGLAHWSDVPGFDVFQPRDPDERLRLFQQAPLRFDPGGHWNYSSPGYLLVARIVERAADQPYATFLTEQIFAPLGLASTTVGHPPTGADVARGHRDGQPVPSWDLTSMAGTGDVWSTVGDLASYTTAVNSGALLSAESQQAQATAHVPLDHTQEPDDRWVVGAGYGYGVFVGTIAGHPAYFHPGDVPGFKSFNAWLPDQRASIAILTNDESNDIEHLVRQLLPTDLKP